MSDERTPTERQIVLAHTFKSSHGLRLFNDGYPEPGSREWQELPYHDRVRIGEERCGLFRDPDGAAETTSQPPYGQDERNPIDKEDW